MKTCENHEISETAVSPVPGLRKSSSVGIGHTWDCLLRGDLVAWWLGCLVLGGSGARQELLGAPSEAHGPQ